MTVSLWPFWSHQLAGLALQLFIMCNFWPPLHPKVKLKNKWIYRTYKSTSVQACVPLLPDFRFLKETCVWAEILFVDNNDDIWESTSGNHCGLKRSFSVTVKSEQRQAVTLPSLKWMFYELSKWPQRGYFTVKKCFTLNGWQIDKIIFLIYIFIRMQHGLR